MSSDERYGVRDLTYSKWRREHLERYQPEKPCDAIDTDWTEYCHYCKQPVAYIEVAQDKGQGWKVAYVTENSGRKADLPTWVFLYTKEVAEPDCPCCGAPATGVITEFRARRLTPSPWPSDKPYAKLRPEHIDELIERLHMACTCRRTEKLKARMKDSSTPRRGAPSPATSVTSF